MSASSAIQAAPIDRTMRRRSALAWCSSAMALHQVQQGVQEDPDEVDKVPVQGGDLQMAGAGPGALARAAARECGKRTDACKHVHRMQPRHHEIQREELL